MQFELWARRRDNSRYELIEVFYNEEQKYYMLDKLDKEIFKEGIVLRTEWQQAPSCVLYEEFDRHYVKRK